METPDLLENVPTTCGDCEHYEGRPPYKTLGNCTFREEELIQGVHLDGMPTPLRIEVVMKAITDATHCPHFGWSEEARRDTESAIHDGYLPQTHEGRRSRA